MSLEEITASDSLNPDIQYIVESLQAFMHKSVQVHIL